MVEQLRKKINDSVAARWTVLVMVSLTMLCGYFMCDVMAPLKSMLGTELGWSNADFGLFQSSYAWLNAVCVMMIVGGIILDRKGARFTGVFATGVMLLGSALKYYAVGFMPSDVMVEVPMLGFVKLQVMTASVGYAIFAFGYETMGITVTKIVVRWFRGKEMALALGMQVAFARLGTMLALALPIPIATYFDSISMPILFCVVLLMIGFMTFLVFIFMDRKLDADYGQERLGNDEKFRLIDIWKIVTVRAFWYIALLCVLFYGAVFPFLKFAAEFMTINFGVEAEYSGLIPALLPLGTLFLTPLFGGIYDKKGKGATIMLIGSLMLVFVYLVFSIPGLNHWIVAVMMVLVLGVAFSLVPSAMWPSVAKIIPDSRLGTAYSLIFWVQNWGLGGVPLLVSYALDDTSTAATATTAQAFDYTVPIYIFLALGVLAVGFALLLKREDRIKGYGLEKPNIKDQETA